MITDVLDTWNKIQILNPNDRTSLRLYGMFLIEILNEKVYGQAFIDKSLEAINTSNNAKYFKHDVFSVSTDGTPCILATPNEVIHIFITLNKMHIERSNNLPTHLIRS